MDYSSGSLGNGHKSTFGNVTPLSQRCSGGAGLPWGLVPAPAGPLLAPGLWGGCRGTLGVWAATDTCVCPSTGRGKLRVSTGGCAPGSVMTYSTSLHCRGLVSFALNEIKFTFTRETRRCLGVLWVFV